MGIGTATVNGAVADLGLLPLVVIKAPAGMVLTYVPGALDVTLTVKVQLPLAGIVRPAGKVTVDPPAAATGAPVPPQVVFTLGVAAITTPAGKVSVSGAVSVATAGLLLLNVTVSVDASPALIVAGVKDLASIGAPTKAGQVGTVNVFASVVTVEPNAKALPVRFANCPSVILRPAAVPRKIVPTNVGVGESAALAPIVVAPIGAQNTSEAQAPPARITREFAPVVSAPPGLKM